MSEITLAHDLDTTDAISSSRLSHLTVAHFLFIFIAVAASIIRFTNLGQIPLSSGEATAALATWQFWQPVGVTTELVSPAYFTFTALLSQVLGFNDAVMRLVPALFGLGVVLLPWLLRPHLGIAGTLVTSALLAVSPLATIASRTAGGDAVALFAILLLLGSWVRYHDAGTTDSRWFYVVLAALGLGLSSSPLFYSGLLTLVFAWWIHQALGSTFSDSTSRLWPDADVRRRAAVLGIVVFLATATFFLWYPLGLGTAMSLAADWLGKFSFQGGLESLLTPFLAVARYEIILIPLGITAIAWVIWRDNPLANLSIYWLAGIFILILLQRGNMDNALLVTLPGYLLIGVFSNTILRQEPDIFVWGVAGGTLLVGMLSFIHVARYSRLSAHAPDQLGNVWVVLFVFVFTIATLYFLWMWDEKATSHGLLLGVLALFLFYQWGTGWWLGHYAANDPRERWVEAGTDDDVRHFLDMLQQVSRQIARSDFDLDIFSAVDNPVLRWYLRDYRQVQFSETLPAGILTEVVITPSESDPPLGSDYLGMDFGLLRSGLQLESLGSATPVSSTLRWWLFHETAAAVNVENIIMWVRIDLTQ